MPVLKGTKRQIAPYASRGSRLLSPISFLGRISPKVVAYLSIASDRRLADDERSATNSGLARLGRAETTVLSLPLSLPYPSKNNRMGLGSPFIESATSLSEFISAG
jgi:hypothetical protein